MPDDYFGEEIAARYDAESGDMFDPAVVEPAVAFLAELAGGGAALELGIGTGRIALPLAQRGVPVHGIDLSEAMVARLRSKPGADQIGVTIGDFSTTTVDETFWRPTAEPLPLESYWRRMAGLTAIPAFARVAPLAAEERADPLFGICNALAGEDAITDREQMTLIGRISS